MKKFFILLGVTFGLLQSSVSADALKNNLTNMLNDKQESPSMVNLDGISLNGKPKSTPQSIKTRPASAVIATVNGHNIIKKEADAYLKQRTKGKVTNFDQLPPEQRSRLIQELSLPLLALDAAQKELSKEEKQLVYTRTWMRKEALKMNITDAQALEVYNGLTHQAKENNSTTAIPPFDTIKERLKIQMLEKALVTKLMKDAVIKVK